MTKHFLYPFFFNFNQIGALKTIRTRRQRETDYDNDEKQLLEILLFDGETSGVWLTFWDSEQIKVIANIFLNI